MVALQQFDDLCLLLLLGILVNRQAVEGDLELVSDILEVRVVADDQRDLAPYILLLCRMMMS